MRRPVTVLALAAALLLTGCAGADKPAADKPRMPTAAPSASAPVPVTSPDPTGTQGTTAVTDPTKQNSVTGETSGVVADGTIPLDDTNAAKTTTTPPETQAKLLAQAGVQGNTQASQKTGTYTAEQTQAAYNTLLGFLTTGTRSLPVMYQSTAASVTDQQLASTLAGSLSPWMTPVALQATIERSLALTQVPLNKRSNDQQAWLALVPLGLCQDAQESCLIPSATVFGPPTITAVTGPSGMPAIQVTARQDYAAQLMFSTDDADPRLTPLDIAFTVTAVLEPSVTGGWQVASVQASNFMLRVRP